MAPRRAPPGERAGPPIAIGEMWGLLPSGEGEADGAAWCAIAGADEAWTQRAEYPHKKHDVTLPAAEAAAAARAAAEGGAEGGAPSAPSAAAIGAAPARAAPVRSGFVTKRMMQDLLESALADFDPLTTLYTVAMRRRAGEELRKALMEFGSTAEAHFHFGAAKMQAALSALSGAKHPDIWAVRDVLAYVADREDLPLPDGTPEAPRNAAKVGA